VGERKEGDNGLKEWKSGGKGIAFNMKEIVKGRRIIMIGLVNRWNKKAERERKEGDKDRKGRFACYLLSCSCNVIGKNSKCHLKN
jgi:hypothetical protein